MVGIFTSERYASAGIRAGSPEPALFLVGLDWPAEQVALSERAPKLAK